LLINIISNIIIKTIQTITKSRHLHNSDKQIRILTFKKNINL